MKMVSHKNTLIQRLFIEKLKNTIASYEGKDLTDIDKKLLRGLHEKNIFDNDENKDKMLSGLKNFILKKIEE